MARLRACRQSRITQEQLSKPSALTHKDVRNVENVWNVFLPTQHQASFAERSDIALLSHGGEKSVLWMRSIQLLCSEKQRSC